MTLTKDNDPPRERSYRERTTTNLIEAYRTGIHLLDPGLLKLASDDLDTFFRPEAGVGQWSVRVLLGHLADGEVVNSHRLRRVVAEDGPVLAGWDQDAFVDAGLYGTADGAGAKLLPVAGSVAVIHTIRAWTAEWLQTTSEIHWVRRCLHASAGELTFHELLARTVWHFEHHVWFLRRKVARLRPPQ